MQTETEGKPHFGVSELPRGGTLVEGEEFRLQIGSYPETIKDTMKLEAGVPDLFLLPDDLFDTYRGISNSDLEFPLYFNFYIRGQKCRFICRKDQVRPILRVLREAIFGPFKVYTEREYPDGPQSPGYPDLAKEMLFYKKDPKLPGGRLRLKHMIELHVFDHKDQVEVDGVTIRRLGGNRYEVQRGDSPPQSCNFHPTREAQVEVGTDDGGGTHGCFYAPPLFGVTTIGSGHGFDTESKTSGFIIWVDGKGILVDPPVNSTEWLRENRINPRLIEDLILTHCHADHDSGTLQKVLEEGRIRIHATETVMRSFVAKYSALTQLKASEFRTLFEFVPLTVGTRCTIAGARFSFRYTLHPIPTVGFEVEFEGKSFYYSCDTLYEPETIRSLHEQGILSKSRMYDLLNVPWESSLIFHEAGIPPIHTPLSLLADLPVEIKKRMYLVHVSESAIPEESQLVIAPPGADNTIEIPVPTPQKSLASKILDVICHIDLFSEMNVRKAQEALSITHHKILKEGERFIERGTYGDRFYMILSGEVEVVHEDLPRRLFFTRYDYIGETALILNQPRNADIVARTRTEVLYIEKEDFLRFISGTPLPELFKRLDKNRSGGARKTFEKHRILAALSPLQKNQLMCWMVEDTLSRGAFLYREREPISWYYLIDSGEVRVRNGDREATLGPGSFVGAFGTSLKSTHHHSEAQALTDLHVFKVSAADMKTFFASNPGTRVRMGKSLKDTLRETSD